MFEYKFAGSLGRRPLTVTPRPVLQVLRSSLVDPAAGSNYALQITAQ